MWGIWSCRVASRFNPTMLRSPTRTSLRRYDHREVKQSRHVAPAKHPPHSQTSEVRQAHALCCAPQATTPLAKITR